MAEHGAAPPPETFERIRLETPNCSLRMSELTAAVIRPQLDELEGWCRAWNRAYRTLEAPHQRDPLPACSRA